MHEEGVSTAEFSPDGTLAATGSWDGTARLWDATTGQQLHILHHGGPVWSVAYSADGRRLATASEDGNAAVWDTATGALAAPPLIHSGPVAHAEFSADGHYIVTCRSDGIARAWEATTGKPVSPPLRNGAGRSLLSKGGAGIGLLGLARGSFHPDGHRILTVSVGDSAQLWDLAGGEPVTSSVSHPTLVHTASFSDDGQQASTVSLDGTAYVWNVATAKLLKTTITNLEPPEPRGFTL